MGSFSFESFWWLLLLNSPVDLQEAGSVHHFDFPRALGTLVFPRCRIPAPFFGNSFLGTRQSKQRTGQS